MIPESNRLFARPDRAAVPHPSTLPKPTAKRAVLSLFAPAERRR
jgi:hypothetical protein